MRCQPHQSGEEVIAHPGKPAAASDGQKKGLATPTRTFYCCFRSIMALI